MDNLIVDKSGLSPVGFKLSINAQKFANVGYFCSSASLPGISLPEANAPFRNAQHAMAGDRLDYSPFEIKFNIDEGLVNYLEIFNWMKDNVESGAIVKYDIVLSILTSKNNVSKTVKFIDAFPTALDGLEFDAQASDVTYLSASATFRYTRFEIT
jgi:hypothetical protein